MIDLPSISVSDYLSKTPPEKDWIERLVQRYGKLSPTERIRELEALAHEMSAVIASSPSPPDPPMPLWSAEAERIHGRPV
jgi:hypothetical protein